MPFLSSDLTIAPGQNVSFNTPGDTGSWGYQVQGSASFTNAGNVTITGDTEAGPMVGASVVGFYQPFGNGQNTLFWNKVGATFRVTATGLDGDAYGIRGGGGFMADVTNDGLIEVNSDRNAWGIYETDQTFVLNNTGIIRVTAGGAALGVGFSGTLNNSGQIIVTGVAGNTIGVSVGDASAVLTNSGLISATTMVAGPSKGVAMTNATGSTLTVTNTATGTVHGDFAFLEVQIFVTPQLARQVVENAGLADGAIDLGLGDDDLHNTGSISGYVALGQGADVYYGGGALNGALFGGFGNDTITGGNGVEVLLGEEGNDVIDAGGGDDVIDGGHDSDTLTGGLGADQIYGGYGADVLHGGDGADELDGWEGADTLYGESGSDTIVISKAAYSTGATFDTAVGFDFAQDKIRIESAPASINAAIAAGALSQGTFASDLTAAASASALAANGAVLFTPTAGGYAGSTFLIIDANSTAGYQDGADIVLRLQGAVNVNQLALSTFVAGGSSYQPLPLEVTSSPLYGEGREISGNFTIHQDETLTLNLQGQSIGLAVLNLGSFPAPMVVTNAGNVLITNTQGTSDITGVINTEENINFDLSFINAAGAQFRVQSIFSLNDNGRGAVVRHFENAGDFAVISSGSASGAVIQDAAGASFVNTGTFHISSASSAIGVSIGDYIFESSTFNNSGDILVEVGTDSGYAEGIDIVGATASFINSGTIKVTESSPTIEGVAIAYANFTNATLIVQTFENSGLIEADYAIRELQSFSDQVTREVVINTGVIHGKVSLGAGNDEIRNSNQMVGAVDLGAGNDVYDGTLGSLVGLLSGGDGNDTIAGWNGAETFSGGNGTDFIQGRGGADTITGGDGNDWLDGGTGGDSIDGGIGDDVAAYGASTAAVSLDLQSATYSGGDAAGDTLTAVEGLSGSSLNDNLFGNASANRLYGQGGNDFIQGRAGADTIDGGDGADWLDGGIGADTIVGGAGTDVAAFGASATAVSLDLQSGVYSGGDAAGDTLTGIEGLSGSGLNDNLFGNASNNALYGQAGADFIQGRGGVDTIDGGNGDDWLDGGAGADTIIGGAGIDVAAFGASASAVNLDLQSGVYTGGDASGDTLNGVEGLSGSSLNDILSGNATANRLFGQGGNDTLAGRGGDDLLTGGAADDIFVFTDNGGLDRIDDFDDAGNDLIQLSIAGITTFGQVSAAMTQVGADVLIDFATTDILLIGTTLATVQSDDFAFV
jgi:Ca2+-binding RTX toxin-like protein